MIILSIFTSLTFYISACLGTGIIFLRIIKIKSSDFETSPATEVATYFLLGQGLLANVWVFLSLSGLFSKIVVQSVVGIFFIVCVLLGHRTIISLAKQMLVVVNEFKHTNWQWKLLLVTTIVMWLSWITSIGRPPTADATRFYLALPKVVSASQHLKVLPGYEEVASLGLQGEMHFAAFMTLKSPITIQLFSWLTLTAGCLLLLALGRNIGLDRHAQLLVFCIVFTSSAVIELSGSGKTDLFALAFSFAAYYWIFKINKKWILTSLLTGLFSGLAIVAKISYIANFLPSLIFILIWKFFIDLKNKNHQFLPFMVIGLSAVFIAIQMPIKNQILFSNPLAPYGMADLVDQVWYGPDTVNRIRLTLPFAIVFGDYWAQVGGISPLLLMFAPLLITLRKPRYIIESPTAVLSIAALFGLLFWIFYRPAAFAPRYFLGCALIISIPISKAAREFSHNNNKMIIATSMITIISVYTFYYGRIFVPLRTIEFINNPENCFSKTHCELISTINNNLDIGERIFMNDSFRYWLRPDTIQCALSTQETQTYLSLETSEQRWKYVVGRGFHSILVTDFDRPLSDTIKADLLDIPDWLEVTIIENNYLLFLKLKPQHEIQETLFSCREITPNNWGVTEIYQ